MAPIVRKYGGSSLATVGHVRRVADAVALAHRQRGPLVVVVSAMGDTTDELLSLVDEAGGSRTERETDQLLATGETVSAAVLSTVLGSLGVPAVSLTGAQAGIRARGKHGEGLIEAVDTRRVLATLHSGRTAVVTGFQGVDRDGDTVTLGRGGSDTTAVALAATLGADRCEIHTDVDGVLTADPRLVGDARVLPVVDSGVLTEMAFSGAKVLHSRAVELAALHGVEVHVRSTVPRGHGTVVPPGAATTPSVDGLVAIAHDRNVAHVLLDFERDSPGGVPDVFAVLAENAIPVDMVARSMPEEPAVKVGFTIRFTDVDEVDGVLRSRFAKLGARVRIDTRVGRVSLIGDRPAGSARHAARLLPILSAADVPVSWLAVSPLNTAVLLPADRLGDIVRLLHDQFRLGRQPEAPPAPRSLSHA
ncbi:aspartate kinase [Prauserella shujinwangii]|uniref:Aspartokinase n=1 Tax=Prauserella shujinwangii TaxID=1453103 RepID=A0A2T0LTD4_9PSEU|nr:aspartate kinase [Prauserella shujinwangii]PRX46963.1 aspartate kinase [Prauserella shujinwangii]